MAQQSSSNELQSQMEKLVEAFHEVADRDELLHRAELTHIFSILGRTIKDKQIISQLPQSEKGKLAELLPKIDDVLQQCKARLPSVPAKPKQKKKMPSMSDCNPFKSRSSSPSHDQGKQQGDDDQGAAALSLEEVKQLTIPILGDAPPPPNAAEATEEVVYYEWTTSYVDESRIYGWDDKADEVVDALVGPRPPADQADKKDDAPAAEANNKDASKVETPAEAEELLFRAAGIAGIHGSGKTALAQKVFVHDRIKDAFPLRLWVCVGPLGSDSEKDRAGLLYRMLDNLGLDTYKVEEVVDNSDAVKKSKEKDKSKIGVLLFILHVTLYRTGYLIVFDDIRAYDGKDGWYSNLTLQPPKEDEWFDRLAYGLPKAKKSAVLVTCRKEDDARIVVRTGSVFRPPELGVTEGWKLFEREYNEAKKKGGGGTTSSSSSDGREEDKLYKELKEMQEEIVGKCLGLPVAIVEAAKGFAKLESFCLTIHRKLNLQRRL